MRVKRPERDRAERVELRKTSAAPCYSADWCPCGRSSARLASSTCASKSVSENRYRTMPPDPLLPIFESCTGLLEWEQRISVEDDPRSSNGHPIQPSCCQASADERRRKSS